MSPPTRRSSRLRATNGTPYKPTKEQDATPSRARANIDLIPSTPATAGRIQPPRSEMHPAQERSLQSTKKEDTGIGLGFSDMPEPLTTPSKSEFHFRFARPIESLGPEAQLMMKEIREEAQRIKTELQAKHEEKKAQYGDGTNRKFALPKGKKSRYSDAHMEEFKKMDSIAGHPSLFRMQPGKMPTSAENPKSLKRIVSQNTSSRLENPSPSKRPRQLGAQDTSSYAKPLSKDGASRIPSKPSTPSAVRSSKFLDMITTPTQSSLARSSSNNNLAGTPTKSIQRSPSKMHVTPGLLKSATMSNINNVASPAKESTHRFADKMKSILRRGGQEQKEEMAAPPPPTCIPSLNKSPSRPNLDKALPSVPTTPLPSQLPRSKSMKSIKQVSFTPATIAKDIAQQSPTPMKSGIPRSKSSVNLNAVAYPSLPSPSKPVERSLKKQPGRFFIRPTANALEKTDGEQSVNQNTEQDTEMSMSPPAKQSAKKPVKESEPAVEYPTLPQAVQSPVPAVREPMEQPLPVPGLFTFAHGTQIKFGTPPRNNFGNSPAASSIRKVRESLVSTASMPGAFPVGNNKENNGPVPAIAHGFSNKKRARAASPNDDLERDDGYNEAERSPKKRKQVAAEGQMLVAPRLVAAKLEREANAPRSLIPSPAKAGGGKTPVKKGGLSMSRLRALATPKRRA